MSTKVIPFSRHLLDRESLIEQGDTICAGDRRPCPDCGASIAYRHLGDTGLCLAARCDCGFVHIFSTRSREP